VIIHHSTLSQTGCQAGINGPRKHCDALASCVSSLMCVLSCACAKLFIDAQTIVRVVAGLGACVSMCINVIRSVKDQLDDIEFAEITMSYP